MMADDCLYESDKKSRLYKYIAEYIARLSLCFIALMIFTMLPAKDVSAEGFDYNAWLTAEQAKYPAEKYWNHVGMTTDNSEGYTDKPCSLHWTYGVDHINGTGGCTCNHFGDPGATSPLLLSDTDSVGWHASSSQCMGFANKIGYDLFGSTTWARITAKTDPNYLANIRVGDIIRVSGHSSFVYAKTEDGKFMVAECNYTSKTEAKCCVIAWGRTIDLSNPAIATGFQYYERAQNYDGIISGTIAPIQGKTEQPAPAPTTETGATTEAVEQYTGWRVAEDGANYQYIKNGEVLSNKWITLSKKKYYLDGNGYRATGLCTIKNKYYYFDESGVLQKNKWMTIASKTYYFGASGYALKSQWLYKGKYLVYVKSNCIMAKSELVKISGSTYLFNSKGRRSSGFKKCNKKNYYCNSYGIILKKQWIYKGKKRYYVNKSGVRISDKLVKISGSKYYFNKKGVMQKNKEIEYDGKVYKAGGDGRCKYLRDVESVEDTEENTEI